MSPFSFQAAEPPRSHPAGAASGSQLASLRRQPAPAWQPDGGVHGRGRRGVAAEPRTTRGGQSRYSPLANMTALTLGAAFRLAYRQAKELIGSIVGLLGPGLPVPVQPQSCADILPALLNGAGHSRLSEQPSECRDHCSIGSADQRDAAGAGTPRHKPGRL